MLIYTHPACLTNDPGPGYPDHAGRLHALLDGLTQALGERPDVVRGGLVLCHGLAERGECPTMVDLLDRFDPAALPAEPWTFDPSGDQPAVDPFA